MHIPVLLKETLEALRPSKGQFIVDATVNGGGHSEAIALACPGISILGIDLDQDALIRSEAKLKNTKADFNLVCASYVDMADIIASKKLRAPNGIIFDFGLSSDQYESGRGFSFAKDEPLLMTFKANLQPSDLTAYQVVNEWQRDSLETIIDGFGEERYAGRIARAIVEARMHEPIETTTQLVQIIEQAVPRAYLHGRIHPATRTFQAIRIAVNGELQSIERGLRIALEALAPGGRICAISFHSLEDRIVKRIFKEAVVSEKALLVNKKPLVPTSVETKANPRARSAKMRILEKI